MKHLLSFLSMLCLGINNINPLLAQWVQTGLSGTYVHNFATTADTNLFVAADSGAFLSTNDGVSWMPVNSGLPTGVYCFGVSGTTLFCASGGTIYRSTNNGTNWTWSGSGVTNSIINCFAAVGTKIFVGTGQGVFRSTNDGTNWIQVNNGLGAPQVWCFAVRGVNLLAGTANGLFLSTNNGENWTSLNFPPRSVNDLAFAGTNLFAVATSQGIFRSTNNGTNWIPVNSGLSSLWIYHLVVSDTNLFVSTGRVYLSTNNGTNWSEVNSGLPTNTYSYALGVTRTNLYLSTMSMPYGVWRRPLSEMITSVKGVVSGMPTHFTLEQNYPNPFNPSTTIRYQIATRSRVALQVFDLFGREVASLVDEIQEPGYRSVRWDASNVASGVYFYRLKVGTFLDARKMLLIK